jgi:hypothetical protein
MEALKKDGVLASIAIRKYIYLSISTICLTVANNCWEWNENSDKRRGGGFENPLH